MNIYSMNMSRAIIFCAAVIVMLTLPAVAVVVNFPDPNLEAVIREAINKPTGDIEDTELQGLPQLIINSRDVSNLQGVQYCVNLELLSFAGNLVSDLSPIAQLTKIKNLCGHSNPISDITPLANLVNMEELDLGGNYVTDLAPLSGMTKLRRLWLWGGQGRNIVQSLAPLATCYALEDLQIVSTVISDVSPLANLTALTSLHLYGDAWDDFGEDGLITDITPLGALTSLKTLNLVGNKIQDISILSGLTNLESLHLGYNLDISSVAPLASLSNLTELDVAGTAIADLGFIRTRTNWTLLALGNTKGENRIPLSQLDFLAAQNNLAVLHLSGFDFSGAWLSNISGLINLTQLGLMGNQINDITPLATLVNLKNLWLHHNEITDIGALGSLVQLESVMLRENPLSQIDPLSGLLNLVNVNADHCEIVDISPFAGLVNLNVLSLYYNQIQDVSPLSNLPNIQQLELQNNAISDLSPLVSNQNLASGDVLNIEDNPLSSDSLCSYIPALEARGVTVHASQTCWNQHSWKQNPANGHYYTVTEPMSWLEARLAAGQLDGYLAVIDSQQENDWVFSNFATGEFAVHIGASDTFGEGIWRYVTGERATFLPWAPGQPDDHDGTPDPPHEDYGTMYGTNGPSPGDWNDVGIVDPPNTLRGIVERDTVPDSSSWRQVLQQAEWPARLIGTFLTHNGKLWILGGKDNNYEVLADVWSSADGSSWSRVTDSAGWGPRTAHASVSFDEKLWVFGGDVVSNPNDGKNDVWNSTDGETWNQVTANAPWGERYSFGALVFDGKLWVFGGCRNVFETLYADVWWSEDGVTWTQATRQAPWPPRRNFACAVFKGRMWVMGGHDKSGFLNDVWYSSDGTNWIQATSSASWSPRYNPQAVVLDDNLWLIGGDAFWNDDNWGIYSNDVWNTANGQDWNLASTAAPWWGRCYFGLTTFDDRIWLTAGGWGPGGRDQGPYLNDLWSYSPSVELDCSYYRDTFESQWAALRSELGLGNEPVDIDGDGLPELWALRLAALLLCTSNPWHEAAYSVYAPNLAMLDMEGAEVQDYREVLAALLSMSQDLQDDLIARLGLAGGYVVFQDATKAPNEPLSGEGDLDRDGVTNYEEFWNVYDQGGDVGDFVRAAMDPELDGSEQLPAASTWGLLLLTLALAAVGMVWIKRRVLCSSRCR